jgi:hypothetical protein
MPAFLSDYLEWQQFPYVSVAMDDGKRVSDPAPKQETATA